MELAGADAFVFDVDGTLLLSEDPNSGAGGARTLGGARELLGLLRARGKRYACFTNGTGQTPPAIAARLRGSGLDVQDTEVLTPATVAAEHIRSNYPGEVVLAFGTEGLLQPLEQAGIPLVRTLADGAHARVLLIGADPSFTYDKLIAACRAVWNGAPMLVTSMAPYFASAGGRLPSTSGAIAAGIRHVTGAEPIVVGKPSPLVLEVTARVLGASPSRLVVVGDDVQLEIRMAHAVSALSVLVLTGTSSEADVAATPAQLRPDLVVPEVGALAEFVSDE